MGEFFGQAIIFFYILAVLKYVFKLINKVFGVKLAVHEKFYFAYKKVTKIIMKAHNIFGALTILFILSHFTIEFSRNGLNITGLIAATAMIAQILLGLYGAIAKRKWKYWISLHRFIAFLILLAILIHTV